MPYPLHITLKALLRGYTTILIEGPMGSGKSTLAMALAEEAGNHLVIGPGEPLPSQRLSGYTLIIEEVTGREALLAGLPPRYSRIILVAQQLKGRLIYPHLTQPQSQWAYVRLLDPNRAFFHPGDSPGSYFRVEALQAPSPFPGPYPSGS